MTSLVTLETLDNDIHKYLLRFLCNTANPLDIISLCAASPVIYRRCNQNKSLSRRIHELIVGHLHTISNDAVTAQVRKQGPSRPHSDITEPHRARMARLQTTEITVLLRTAVFKHKIYDDEKLRLIAPILAFLLEDFAHLLHTQPHPLLKRLRIVGTASQPKLTGHPDHIKTFVDGIMHELVGLVYVKKLNGQFEYILGAEYRREWIERVEKGKKS